MRIRGKGEEGGLLIILMIGVAIATIALGAAVQAWSVRWRRDNEEELIFRANQYVTAILAYRKEHGGQFPTNLDVLFEPGPRRVRYIRQLYEDPISESGKWGLLYLMPGGQGVYDPGAAKREKAESGSGEWTSVWDSASSSGTGAGQAGVTPITQPGVTSINTDPAGTGVPGAAAPVRGAPAMAGGSLPSIPASSGGSSLDADSISEPTLGWPVVGVVSRTSGSRAENTYRVYKGHEHVNEWQFHVFDRGIQLQEPAEGIQRRGQQVPFIGPGIGGKGKIGGLIGGGGQGAKPGSLRSGGWQNMRGDLPAWSRPGSRRGFGTGGPGARAGGPQRGLYPGQPGAGQRPPRKPGQ